MKKRLLIGLLLILLPFADAFGDDTDAISHVPPASPAMINIFADKFLARIWPQLPESYRIMASISASKLVDGEHPERKNSPPEPLVGISLTIEW